MDKEQKDQRIPLMMEPSLVRDIDQYRYANEIPTRARAIRLLIRHALKNTEMPVSAGK